MGDHKLKQVQQAQPAQQKNEIDNHYSVRHIGYSIVGYAESLEHLLNVEWSKGNKFNTIHNVAMGDTVVIFEKK